MKYNNYKKHIRFNDEAGQAALTLHSQRDLQLHSQGDTLETVGGQKTTTVFHGNHVQLVDGVLHIKARDHARNNAVN